MPINQPSSASVSVYDARPFFEKALQFGVKNGIIDQPRLDAICTDAPKGMVQIARYFGSEFLRPELEKARERIVNLVSLYLESSTGGDLQQAAESLRDYSFMSRSKGGSDMLKALIAMPQNSHFGMSERRGFTDAHIPLLAKWSLRSLADYQAELAQRSQVAQVMDAAIWLADQLGMDSAELEEAGKDAEAVIRTALLVMAAGRTEMPDWVAFDKLVLGLRKKYAVPAVPAVPAAPEKARSEAAEKRKGRAVAKPVNTGFSITIPGDLPENLRATVEAARQSIMVDLPKILDAALPVRQLFDQTPAFMGRYFWIDDGLNEVSHHDRLASAAWNKVTGGNTDDGSLLTLFLSVAASAPPKTILTEKNAAALIRKIQKSGFQPELAESYIQDHAPVQYQDDYLQLWEAFVDEAGSVLQSDSVSAFNDALSLLRRECNVKQA
ncbi:MAG: hypothetical protein V4772_06800 [Pseudomonadota bacterium]